MVFSQNTSQGASPLEIPSCAAFDEIRSFHSALGDLEVRSQESEEETRIVFEWDLSNRLTASRESRMFAVSPYPISFDRTNENADSGRLLDLFA
jgi:hypothetical protein